MLLKCSHTSEWEFKRCFDFAGRFPNNTLFLFPSFIILHPATPSTLMLHHRTLSSLHPLSFSLFKHKAFCRLSSDEEWLIYHILSHYFSVNGLLLAKAVFNLQSGTYLKRDKSHFPCPIFLDSHCPTWILMYSHWANPQTFSSCFSLPTSSFLRNNNFTVKQVRQ